MRRTLAAVAAALLATAGSASAAPGYSYPTVIQAPYCAVALTTAAAVTLTLPCPQPGITAGRAASTLVGVANNSSAAQTAATMTCYDSPTASGVVAASVGQLAATQVITWPGAGRPLLVGLTCQPSSVPSGAGIEVYYR